ncbi:MAG: glycosyltransferase family 8 protein [Selenomonadaceae bacterium]|nr:glycosyltransferase family 8 protein [Selenomonadaceae bacterium]
MCKKLDLQQFIYRKESFGNIPQSEENKDRFNIAFGVDSHYVPQMGIMITSILINNPDCNLYVHVFLNSILDEDINKLKTLSDHYRNIQIDVYYIDVSVFKNFHVGKSYTVATYNRIIIAQVLYPSISKLLYIDADTLCVGKILELKNLSFDDKMILAVLDRGDWLPAHKQEIKIPESQDYFNAGVLYIDLQKWNEFKMSEKMIELLNERKLSYQDQDALNLIAIGQIKAIPVRFNQFFLMNEENEDIPSDTLFLHFAGLLKPWQPWCENPKRLIYHEYLNKSLWSNFVYKPRNYREKRMMGNAALHQNQFSTALKWYYLYLREKLKL